MTQGKIEGKFYPLQHDEWLRACHELTPAQRDVLYFIRTLAPYGNGIKISAAEIARRLSTPQKTVHRQTISRALKELDVKGFIDLELIEVQIQIKPKGYWCDETPAVCQDTTLDPDTPQVIATHQTPSETQSEQGLPLSKTYKDFKDSLPDNEGENFLNFVREQVKNLPQPINDVEGWLANENKAGQNRWEVYYQNFLAKQSTKREKTRRYPSLREEIEERIREFDRLKSQETKK